LPFSFKIFELTYFFYQISDSGFLIADLNPKSEIRNPQFY